MESSRTPMEVFHIFDVRKHLLAGLSLPARMCKLNTQSLAHAIPCLTTCFGCLVLQMGKMRPRSFCDISDLGTLSLKHACSSVVACSKPVLLTPSWTQPFDSETCSHDSSSDHSSWFRCQRSFQDSVLPIKFCLCWKAAVFPKAIICWGEEADCDL